MKFKKLSPDGFDFFFSEKDMKVIRHLDSHFTTVEGDLFFERKLDKVEAKAYPRGSFGEGKSLFVRSPVYGASDKKPPYKDFHVLNGAESGAPRLGIIMGAPLSLVKRPPKWIVYEVMVSGHVIGEKIHPAIYIGQTTKGLMRRIRQHLAECRTSNVRFKRHMRAFQGTGQLTVRVLAHGYDGGAGEALAAETKFILAAVKHASDNPEKLTILNTSLNSGVFVNRVKEITGEDVSAEEAEERHSQLVWAGQTWMGDVERTIGTVCNNPNNFSVDEVEQLIMLRDIGYGQEATARVMDCSLRRVQDFFNRRTYQFLQLPEAA